MSRQILQDNNRLMFWYFYILFRIRRKIKTKGKGKRKIKIRGRNYSHMFINQFSASTPISLPALLIA
jgi:hypothetical protein